VGLVKPLSPLPPLPYGRQFIDDGDVDAVVSTLRGDWLTQGPKVAEFEARLTEITGAKYAVAVANGTAALHLACLAAKVGPGTTGVTSTITFVASANCIRYAGGRPYLCDVDPETSLLSLRSLRERVETLAAAGTPPKVILPVDMTGAVPDLAEVRKIADSVGALVIEDAAHSLGATYAERNGSEKGERAASCRHAHMATLSFHPVKHITTGEGGAILTNDPALHQDLLELRTHGITRDPARMRKNDGPWYYEQRALGFNYRITDLQCALGVSQLRKLPGFLAQRRALAAMYDEALRPLEGKVRPLTVPAGCTSAYHLYVVRIAGGPDKRLAAFTALREAKIFAQVHYIPVHTQPDFVDHDLGGGEFPGAEAYYAGALSLPMFPAMTKDDVLRVVAALGDAL
jgi:UDP-4-amino-4,6-dideoxy-N-acetyl-beta-L-altrosamine transaminase